MSMAASSGERHGRPGPDPGTSVEYNNEQSVDFYPRYGLVVSGSMGMEALDTGNRTMTIEYELCSDEHCCLAWGSAGTSGDQGHRDARAQQE